MTTTRTTAYILETVRMGSGYLSTPNRHQWVSTWTSLEEARAAYAAAAADPRTLAAMLVEWTCDAEDRDSLPHGSWAVRNCALGAMERMLASGERPWSRWSSTKLHAYTGPWRELTIPKKSLPPAGPGGAWNLRAPAMSPSSEAITPPREYPWKDKVADGWVAVSA